MNVLFHSQSLESTAEQLRLRSPEFLQDHDIEVLTEKEVRVVSLELESSRSSPLSEPLLSLPEH